MIWPCGDSFTDATYVVRELNKIVNNCWMGQYISFSSAPKEVKNLWWNEFKRKFRWDEMEENEVRRIFKKKAGDHMRNVMNKAKRNQQKPDFIKADNCMEITRTWETEKHKQISEQNKKNRASSSSEWSASATYAGGSINIGEHRKRMADELGTEPTFTATFKRTFQKKDKMWTGDPAKAIKEKYDELLMSTASSGDGGDGGDGVAASEPSVDSMALWLEASGGMKGGKIFGMGSLSRAYTTKAAATSSSNAAISRRTQHEEQMTQKLSQLKDLLVQKDEEFKHLLVQKDEEMRGMKQQMQLILRHLNLDHDEVPPVPPTNPIGDGHNDEPHNDNEIAADDDDDFISSPC
ncbi:uncharacterized protein LOC130135997 [Syzygium oleosum]|uniref:uncharacterized protein LOC130135997 n=1 Tax=Syzygium oleosum TaxID=219896 RepID=UPI0024B98A58|nr:uncharacterized protein LOC130135997 [Syzygium oleosum]